MLISLCHTASCYVFSLLFLYLAVSPRVVQAGKDSCLHLLPIGLPPDYLSNLHLHRQCFSMVYSFLFMPKSNSRTHWLLYAQLYCQFAVCVKKRLHELRPEKLYCDAKYFNGARRISFVLCSMHSAFLSDCNHL